MWPPSSSPIFSARSRLIARAGLPARRRGQPQRLFPGLDLEPARVGAALRQASHGQADAGAGDRRADGDGRGIVGGVDAQPHALRQRLDRGDRADIGDDAGEHQIGPCPFGDSGRRRNARLAHQAEAGRHVVLVDRRRNAALADHRPRRGTARCGRPAPRRGNACAVSAPPSTRTLDMPCAARSSSSSGSATRPSKVSVARKRDAGAFERRLAAPDRPRRRPRPAAAPRAPSATSFDVSGSRALAVEHDARRRAALQPRQPHGQQRIVGERRADADQDRVGSRPHQMHLRAARPRR